MYSMLAAASSYELGKLTHHRNRATVSIEWEVE